VRSRKLLAEAGYPNGLSLKLAYFVFSSYLLDAQSMQASLQRAGIEVQLIPSTGADFYSRLLPNPENARRGIWDIAITGWVPDWFGGNNGRSVLAPLFDGRHFGLNTRNYGGYSSREVNALIDRAIVAPSVEEAEHAWAEAAQHVMDDAAFVPLVEEKQANYRSARTRGCTISIFSLNCDLTAIWLKDASPAQGEKR
jgi:peptide/nickel transport system substrate-binding protein